MAKIRLLGTADQSVTARIDSIQNAKKEVFIESFYLENDETGIALINKLKELKRASPQLDIRLLLDAWGSESLPQQQLCNLIADGIPAKIFNKSFGPAQHRTHRKIWYTDYSTIIGGRNLSDENLKSENTNAHTFYDWDAELQGPVTSAIKKSFVQAWNHPLSHFPDCKNLSSSNNDSFNKSNFEQVALPGWKTANVDWFADPVGNSKERPVLNQVLNLISATQKTLEIENAYFIPVSPLSEALGNAEKRKLKISFHLNGPKMQSWMSKYSSCLPLNNLKWWLKKGAQIFITPAQKRTHAKSILSDRKVLAIGSFNFDSRSINMNAETMLVINNSTELIQDYLIEYNNRLNSAHNISDVSQIFQHYQISGEQEKECRDISFLSPFIKYWF